MNILLIGGCGYIGSALFPVLVGSGHRVESVDCERRGNPSNVPNRKMDFARLTRDDVDDYDTVILLAAHASVAEAAGDPAGAFRNNVVAFHDLLQILDRQRLIYASSSSVYTGRGGTPATETSSWSFATNMYDFSKFIDDGLAALSDVECYGLRFGTVNGPSPNLRQELMLNRMVQAALDDGVIRVSNPNVHRPILGITDLTRAITGIVEGSGAPGVYNLASFNSTVLELATAASHVMKVPLEIDPDRPTYDFTIETTKFETEYDFRFTESAESIIAALADAYGRGDLKRCV